MCIEPVPGANAYIIPEEEAPNVPDFVDRNIYCYREDGGVIKFRGVVLGHGWENQRFRPDKLICYREKGETKGEKSVAKYDWDALWPRVLELQAEGKTAAAIAKVMDINLYALKSKIYRENEQTPNPEPVTAANQEPEEGEGEPAEKSVAWGASFDEGIKMSLGEALPRKREPYTGNQELARDGNVNINRISREPWEEECVIKEQIESWVMDLWRMDINKARKLRLLESLLDMGVTEC